MAVPEEVIIVSDHTGFLTFDLLGRFRVQPFLLIIFPLLLI